MRHAHIADTALGYMSRGEKNDLLTSWDNYCFAWTIAKLVQDYLGASSFSSPSSPKEQNPYLLHFSSGMEDRLQCQENINKEMILI